MDEDVMRGWNVYAGVDASVVVVKDCIGSAIIQIGKTNIDLVGVGPERRYQSHYLSRR